MKVMSLRESKGDKVYYIVSNIIIFLVIIAVIYPLYFVLIASISDSKQVIMGNVLLLPKNITFMSYVKIIKDELIVRSFFNTVSYTIVGTTISLTLTTIGAYALSKKTLPGRKLITLFCLITMFVNGGLIPTYLVIKSLGMVDKFWVMVLPGSISMYNLIVMRTFFVNIPEDLIENSEIEGCNPFQTLIKIVLPLSLPVISVMILFYGVYYWNMYFRGLIYLTSEEKFPLQLVLRNILIQNSIENFVDAPDETALEQALLAESLKYSLIIVTSIPVLLLYPFLQKYFVKGVMIGAIKG